jgi:putative transposase
MTGGQRNNNKTCFY